VVRRWSNAVYNFICSFDIECGDFGFVCDAISIASKVLLVPLKVCMILRRGQTLRQK
jgi:hypothetical protein